MPAYAYKALDAAGKTKSGVLEADNPRQVRQQLREQSFIPLEVAQVEEQKHSDKSVSSDTHLTLPTLHPVASTQALSP